MNIKINGCTKVSKSEYYIINENSEMKKLKPDETEKKVRNLEVDDLGNKDKKKGSHDKQ
ncbi:MAG: hypothetical protein E7H80_03940 [Thomasclavelia ramosa]|nr:hypothetical protein [Thomasclavelia ramosa]